MWEHKITDVNDTAIDINSKNVVTRTPSIKATWIVQECSTPV